MSNYKFNSHGKLLKEKTLMKLFHNENQTNGDRFMGIVNPGFPAIRNIRL